MGGMEKSFLTAHATPICVNKAKKQHGVAFSSTNTAGPIDHAPTHATPTTASDILPQIETYMENIAAAATTNHKTLEALVASTKRLTQTNAAQHSTANSL